MRSKINTAMNTIKNDVSLITAFDNLAALQVTVMTDPTLPDIEKNASLILSAKTAKEYVVSEDGTHIIQEVEDGTYSRALNINFLAKRLSRNKNSAFIPALDALMSATGFKFRPKLIGNGTRDGVMGVLNRKFTEKFASNTYASIDHINTPGIELTESVKYQILDIESAEDSGIKIPKERADLDKLANMEDMSDKFNDTATVYHDLYNRTKLSRMLADINSFYAEFEAYLDMDENSAQKEMILELKANILDNMAKIDTLVLNHNDVVTHDSIRETFDAGNLKSERTELEAAGMSAETINDFYSEESEFIDRLLIEGKSLDPALLQHILNIYLNSDVNIKEDLLSFEDDMIDLIFPEGIAVDESYKTIVEDIIKNCYI
jgi:hypothetical protein